jgi:hypothetical protein
LKTGVNEPSKSKKYVNKLLNNLSLLDPGQPQKKKQDPEPDPDPNPDPDP